MSGATAAAVVAGTLLSTARISSIALFVAAVLIGAASAASVTVIRAAIAGAAIAGGGGVVTCGAAGGAVVIWTARLSCSTISLARASVTSELGSSPSSSTTRGLRGLGGREGVRRYDAKAGTTLARARRQRGRVL